MDEGASASTLSVSSTTGLVESFILDTVSIHYLQYSFPILSTLLTVGPNPLILQTDL